MRFRINRGAILGAIVAVAGSALALSTSYALYTKAPEDKTINISAHTDKDITLNATNIKRASDNDAYISPDHPDVFTFDMSATRPSDQSEWYQDYFVAKLTVTINANSDELITALKSSTVEIDKDGLNEQSSGDETQGTSLSYVETLDEGENGNTYTSFYGDYWKSNGAKIEYSSATATGPNTGGDGAGGSSGEQTPQSLDNEGSLQYSISGSTTVVLPVTSYLENTVLRATAKLSLGEMTAENFVNLTRATDGADYSVSIDLSRVDDSYQLAYVRGSMNNWQDQDKYQMVPDPKANSTQGFVWIYSTHNKSDLITPYTSDNTGDEWKCVKPQASGGSDVYCDSNTNNHKLDQSNTGGSGNNFDTIGWTGTNSTDIQQWKFTEGQCGYSNQTGGN